MSKCTCFALYDTYQFCKVLYPDLPYFYEMWYVSRTLHESSETCLIFLSFMYPELWLWKTMRKNAIFLGTAIIQTFITMSVIDNEHSLACLFYVYV